MDPFSNLTYHLIHQKGCGGGDMNHFIWWCLTPLIIWGSYWPRSTRLKCNWMIFSRIPCLRIYANIPDTPKYGKTVFDYLLHCGTTGLMLGSKIWRKISFVLPGLDGLETPLTTWNQWDEAGRGDCNGLCTTIYYHWSHLNYFGVLTQHSWVLTGGSYWPSQIW